MTRKTNATLFSDVTDIITPARVVFRYKNGKPYNVSNAFYLTIIDSNTRIPRIEYCRLNQETGELTPYTVYIKDDTLASVELISKNNSTVSLFLTFA